MAFLVIGVFIEENGSGEDGRLCICAVIAGYPNWFACFPISAEAGRPESGGVNAFLLSLIEVVDPAEGAFTMGAFSIRSNKIPSGERIYSTGVPHSTVFSTPMLIALRASLTAISTAIPS